MTKSVIPQRSDSILHPATAYLRAKGYTFDGNMQSLILYDEHDVLEALKIAYNSGYKDGYEKDAARELPENHKEV